MPYGSFHVDPARTVAAALRLVKEAGATAVKIEGGRKRAAHLTALLAAEIPVMGHLGLTPQSVNRLGGYKVQGRGADAAARLLEEARFLEEAGCFALVLECIPAGLAAAVSRASDDPHHRHRRGRGLRRPGAGVPRHARAGRRTRSPASSSATPTWRPRAPKPWPATWPTCGPVSSRDRSTPTREDAAPEAAGAGNERRRRLPGRPDGRRRGRRVRILRTAADLDGLDALRGERPLVLVPTMGALHEGHLSLVRRAADLGPVVVSIFVNPTQFGPGEDFAAYPRELERDLAAAGAAGAGGGLRAGASTVYPSPGGVMILPGRWARGCAARGGPDHFTGVLTVVAKLFGLVRPDVAVFGRKDAQQCLVIAEMVRDLELPVRLLDAPTVREPDGLALSSRNRYLDADGARAGPVPVPGPGRGADPDRGRRARGRAAVAAAMGEHLAGADGVEYAEVRAPRRTGTNPGSWRGAPCWRWRPGSDRPA